MVYTTVEIILGVSVTRENLEKMIDVDEGGYVDEICIGTTIANENVNVHQFPCCSEAAGQQYIVGISLHKYYRKHGIRCEKCPDKYHVCNTCLGTTNNGCYDVDSFYSGPVEANIRHICLHCFSDNKRDLLSPQKDLPVLNNRVQGDKEDMICCNTCGIEPDWRFSPETSLKRVHHYEQLKEVLKRCNAPKNCEIKFYYVVDDCMSCT